MPGCQAERGIVYAESMLLNILAGQVQTPCKADMHVMHCLLLDLCFVALMQ